MPVTHHLPLTRTAVTLLTALSFGLTGCGSDGGSNKPLTSTIKGSVFAAPVNGATCEIQDDTGTVIAGPITTTSTGAYSVDIPDSQLGDDLMLICDGGSYTDESDGSTQTAGTLSAYVAGGTLAAGVELHATPDSTIIHQLVREHNMTLTTAQTAFQGAFGYTPDSRIAPTNATAPDAAATDDQLLAGLRAAAFSQLTRDVLGDGNQGYQFALLDALALDLADNTMDGDATGAININGTAINLPADIQNQFGTSMLNFHTGSNNATGLSNDLIGTLPFAPTALTSTYKVEYVAGAMKAMTGKTMFQIRLTDLATDTPADGVAVTLMPMMYMATKNHSTPVDGACTENATAGTYDCTIYYVMASVMMDGMSMGYWDLKVMLGGMMGEVAHFHPPVMMPMGDTALVKLRTEEDAITMMGETNPRTLLLFKSKLMGTTGDHTFQIFTATMETMMSFPAVTSSSTFHAGTPNELAITSMSIEISTDASTWVTATEDGNGYWTATGLTGLTESVEGEVYVRLTINDNVYNSSIDGVAATGINEYATFTVTPGAM